MRRILTVAAAAALVAAPAAARERARVQVTCAESSDKLHYDCMLHVIGRKSKRPVDGAEITVKADMPAMPGAHNIPAVKPEPAGKPGMYKWRMRLDMYGVWALRITLKGPVRDIMVKKIDFRGKGGQKMDHGKHKHH
jgi:hypothetical protein